MKKIAVIGGGPAGLFSSFYATLNGADVTLFEKNGECGWKLKISGKGRCNITNSASLDQFVTKFRSSPRIAKRIFYTYFRDDLLGLLSSIGVDVKEERGGRIFPVSESAVLVRDKLVKMCVDGGVRIKTAARVESIEKKDEGFEIRFQSGLESKLFDLIIIATGGLSYPKTGSTGDGYKFAKALGHTVTDCYPALVPLVEKGNVSKKFQGISLKNIELTLWGNGKKVASEFGEMLFTHFGITGPVVLTLSRHVSELKKSGTDITVTIDFKPALDHSKLDKRLLREFESGGKKKLSTLLKHLLPGKIAEELPVLLGIPPERVCNTITAVERKKIRNMLKEFSLKIKSCRSIEEAIVTAGGVDMREINLKTMESKIVDGLYFAGEVLDIDADTGGYNLQAAFSSGYIAGVSAAKE